MINDVFYLFALLAETEIIEVHLVVKIRGKMHGIVGKKTQLWLIILSTR